MIGIEEFKEEVSTWAKQMGVEPEEIHIREMRRKWGSCSSKGRVTFSLELLEKSFGFRANAIVHELLHLRYPEHGKLFRSLWAAHLAKQGIVCSEFEL